MNDPVALAVSALALAVSAVTAWLTLFRKGSVRMTQPTVIYFGPDKALPGDRNASPKVYLRMLLFATSKRGRIVESMHVALARSETHQNFNVWVHGGDGGLVRGSGLFVGESGVATDHHFLTPDDANHFKFIAGRYRLTVFAKMLGAKRPIAVFEQHLQLTPELATQLEQPRAGLYFDWGPDSMNYLPHISHRPPLPIPEALLAALASNPSIERTS